METRRIGSLEVSLVGLGGNNFGMRCDEERSVGVIRAALDVGINFFDTADAYGGTLSEQYLGKALGGHRSEVVIATKFGAPVDADPDHRGVSTRWLVQAVEGSLKRLATDYIDLYYQHLPPDPAIPMEETLGALDGLVSSGKVREVACSNFSGAQIDEAVAITDREGWARMVSAQNQLNLLFRRAVDDVVPACSRHSVGFVPYFPLAAGVLTGKYQRGQAPPDGSRLAGQPERQEELLSDKRFDVVERLAAVAAAAGQGAGHG